ncbi:hypothetical protein [Curvivirga aplysinae]|uniref:hypothetical protein n=1 Tax=Curvivirga aplysinae TaxID=2529852 RepID=UPI0012BC09B8|nr:hypothetical protein [Curvivirga aplysinae]MTI09297.1 hypothetical protein [Curvivirga aplysinae]
MADISGVSNAFNPATAAAGIRNQEEDDRSLLEQLREELREEARVAAREAAQNEANGATSGVTAPDPLNRFSIERSVPGDNQERPRGFQPEDTEDRVELSERAREILAQGREIENEQDRLNAFTSEVVDDTRAVNAERDANDADEASRAFVAADTEEDSLQQEEVEAAESAEFVAEVNAIIADTDQSASDTAAFDESSEDSATQLASGIEADATENSQNAIADQIAENDATVVNFQSEQQAINAETVVNENETNQVAANENDTTEVNGNLDQATQPLGQRVLGQIVDQFA